MKTLKIILFLIAVIFLGMQSMAQKKNVALVTFYVDKEIDLSQLGDGIVGWVAAIKQANEDPAFDLQPTLDAFYEEFFTVYNPLLSFNILPAETVITNPDYIAYQSSTSETFWRRFLSPPGYKIIYPSHGTFSEKHDESVTYMGSLHIGKKENRNEFRLQQIFDDVADGVMFVKLSYAFVEKSNINGVGNWGIRAFLEMVLYNREGEKVFYITENGTSPLSVVMLFKVQFSAKNLLPLCESASDKLMSDLIKKFPRQTKKAVKKL
jgi:hypothetical protein